MTYSTLMAHMELGLSNDHLLSVTAGLAERFHAGVIGVAASQPMQVLEGEMYVAAHLIQLDRDQIEREIRETEIRFRATLSGKAERLGWRAAVSFLPLADYICDQARAVDLIITRPDRGGVPFESSRWTSIGDLVMRAGRPVLIVPPSVEILDLKHILVGWKDTRETRRAVGDAMPLADRVDMATAEARVEDVVAWLAGHGVTAAAVPVQAHGDVTAQLERIAQEREAGLIVAGAYGHTRLREWVFGGVTQEVLMHPLRCTLMSH